MCRLDIPRLVDNIIKISILIKIILVGLLAMSSIVQDACSPLPPLDEARLRRLEEYALSLQSCPLRADQRRRMLLYLRGLLDGDTAKNAEAIAARYQEEGSGSGAAQALQHFLSRSPWDAAGLLARYRARAFSARPGRPRAWAVHDLAFPKKGRCSAGTMRQWARPLGRKVNCQVAVAVSELGPDGFLPLALGLYLPGSWLRERRGLAEQLVPVEFLQHRSKTELVLRAIDDVLAEGRVADFLVADEGFLAAPSFVEGAAQRGLALLAPDAGGPAGEVQSALWNTLAANSVRADVGVGLAATCLTVAARAHNWMSHHLGLGRYEGRNWLGWHHHTALVLSAYGFLASEEAGRAFPRFPASQGTESWT